MSEPTYRIKPLEWQRVDCGDDSRESWEAETMFGDLAVRRFDYGASWRWKAYFGPTPHLFYPADSADAGKAAAEAYYRERLMAALEAVT